MSRVRNLSEVLQYICVVAFVFVLSACSEGIDEILDTDILPEEELPDPPVTPTPPAQPDAELEEIKNLFVGAYGCQDNTALSLVNYDSDASLSSSSCDGNVVVEGTNPSQLYAMSQGVHAYLDLVADPLKQNEAVVFANAGAVLYIDLDANSAERLTSFSGTVCRVIPSIRYEAEVDSVTGDETWNELHDSFVYVEVVDSADSARACQNNQDFRRYFKVALNYDVNAIDEETCIGELDGKSSAANCKTRLLPNVSQARALSYPIRAYVDDATNPGSKVQVYGYIGAGLGSGARELVLWNSAGDQVWTAPQDRNLESFSNVLGVEGAYSQLFAVEELEDNFYVAQLGRDIFVFEGSELFELSDSNDVFKDRSYQLEEDSGNVTKMQIAFDNDDFLIFDQGKFFYSDYKASYSAPVLSKNYSYDFLLARSLRNIEDPYMFSQFDLNDCSYNADPVACADANDVGGFAWQVTNDCTLALNCSFPNDLNDYCVTDAERTPTTPQSELCTPSNYEDLNELDEVANDLSFAAFLPYYQDYMRSFEFKMYDDSLLLNLRLTERDALVVYYYKQPLTAPATVRERLLLGRRLVQSISRPVVQDSGIYFSTNVQGATVSNVCYKGLMEVMCNVQEPLEGAVDECTRFDLDAGTCREGRFLFESRALFCSDTEILSGDCKDSNQINQTTLQIESASQDAKWVPSLSIDATNGVQSTMHVLISDDQPRSTARPNDSYSKDEGILGNPQLYSVASQRTLSSAQGQLLSSVESVAARLVLRENEGAYAVNAEEFVSSTRQRQQDEIYVNQANDQNQKVIGRTIAH
ncbi:hypothetical protein [Oleiphilus sp. HI0066]|uniref:hypothetical protein n=4 Tax=unclassified Oleiphilus TaxID=2631174 RepID=UPI0007C22774|nr:hypothetical protein [Oleiphilus sp. HI0066]KZY61924.1 hypothetical protein A3738_13370 [Oleiphilus sp. HI0066]MCH2159656.1 hypothetical protein [Oleiphilaceae bacterium]